MDIVVAPGTLNKTGGWRSKRPLVDNQKCIRCGTCQNSCPDSAVRVTDNGAEFNYDYCKGCGICSNECPVKCISMVDEK